MSDILQTISYWDSSKIPMDIVCNGFKMKDLIIEVLNKHNTGYNMDLCDDKINKIAEEITDAFAIKLRLKQG